MHNNGTMPDIPVETIAETSNYTIWSAQEPDGETTFHIELGPVTAHFFNEEWQDFVQLIRHAVAEGVAADDDTEVGEEEEEVNEVELDWGSLYFDLDEWDEFLQLIDQV